jgi:outer membrane protein
VKTIILAAALALGSVAAGAQTVNKVGVIQAQSALVSTKDGQKAVADLETRLAPRKKDLEKKQSEIRELQDKLQRGGNAMAEAAKNDLMRTIDTKTKSFNRDMEDAQAEAEQEQRKLLDELSGKMMQTIDKYAQANGFSLILDVSNPNTPVLYASNTVDITKEIIDMYDKTAPTAPASAAPKPAAAPPKPAPAPPPAVKKQP